MKDAYSPHTGEHIATDSPAQWMGRAGTPAPEYDSQTQACFWRGDAWEIVAAAPAEPPALTCSKLQGELALLGEPSPTPDHPTMLHWVEATVDAEADPIRKRTMQAYLNAPAWRSDDLLVPTMWQAAGRDLDELPALLTKAQGL